MKYKNIFLFVLIFFFIFMFLSFISATNSENSSEWWMFMKYLNHTSWDGVNYTRISGLYFANFSTGNNVKSSPAVANGFVYVGSDDNKLYQLNASNVSQLIASYLTGGDVFSSPAVANGYVYVGSASSDNSLYQLNASNVSQLIASFTSSNQFFSSPVVAYGFVYIGGNDKNVYQLNASNVSQQIANFTTGDFIYGTPAVANGFVYIGSDDRNLYQLNASNISQKITNFTTGSFVECSPAVANGYVYVGSFDRNLYQLNASNVAQKIANFSTGNSIESSPAVANGYVYVGSGDSQVYQLNASNVSQYISNFANVVMVTSSPAVANGYVYIGGTDGQVYQLNANNIFQMIANFSAGSSIEYSSPAVANGYVYIGSDNGQVYQLNANNISQVAEILSDNVYPSFSNYYDNNASLTGSGVAIFNVTVANTNMTVFLQINGANYTANNISLNVYNYSLTLTNGTYAYQWISWGNGSSSNYNISGTRYYTVNATPLDTTPPLVIVSYPTATLYTINVSQLNYTVSDIVGVGSCWYSRDSGATNSTGVSAGTNFSGVTSVEGPNSWRVYCNDTTGNVNFSSVTFTKDTVYPSLVINSPTAGQNLSSKTLSINLTVSNVNINYTNIIVYNSSSTSVNSSSNSSSGNYLISLSVPRDGSYSIFATNYDLAGNSNSTSVNVTVDTTNPSLTLISPSNNQYFNSQIISVNFSASDTNFYRTNISIYNVSNVIVNSTINLVQGNNLAQLTVPREGNYTVNLTSSDYAGNSNLSSIAVIVDTTYPSVVINSPTNNQNLTLQTISVNLTVSDSYFNYTNVVIKNISLTTINSSTNTSSGTYVTSLTVPINGIYSITATSYDLAGNSNSTSVNVTVDSTAPYFTSSNTYVVVNHSLSFPITAVDAISGVSKYVLNNWTNIFSINSTSGILTNKSALNVTAIYYLNISVNDSVGNINTSRFYVNVTNDIYSPVINLLSPINSYSSTSTSVPFVFTVNDDSQTNCSIILDGSIIYTNSSVDINGENNSYSYTANVASHSWYVNCSDIYGNYGNSSTLTFTITTTDTTPPRGGGGSSSSIVSKWVKQIKLNDSSLNLGQTLKEMKKNYRITFNVSGMGHSIGITNITPTTVTIEVASTPQTVTLNTGEEKKFELTGDNIYDLSVKLNKITNGTQAEFTIKSISESIPSQTQPATTPQATPSTSPSPTPQPINQEQKNTDSTKTNNYLMGWIVGIIILVVLIIIVIIAIVRNKKENN